MQRITCKAISKRVIKQLGIGGRELVEFRRLLVAALQVLTLSLQLVCPQLTKQAVSNVDIGSNEKLAPRS